LNRVIGVSQLWTENAIEPDGTSVAAADASVDAGQVWPFAGNIYALDSTDVIGGNFEMCTRLNSGEFWRCEGTYVLDTMDCKGHLSFAGPYTDETFTGFFTITGGTGDFLGATGHVESNYNEVTLNSDRKIVIA
jgi:hypothetical protein